MTKHFTYTEKSNGDTINASEWNNLAQDVDAVVDEISDIDNIRTGAAAGANAAPQATTYTKDELNNIFTALNGDLADLYNNINTEASARRNEDNAIREDIKNIKAESLFENVNQYTFKFHDKYYKVTTVFDATVPLEQYDDAALFAEVGDLIINNDAISLGTALPESETIIDRDALETLFREENIPLVMNSITGDKHYIYCTRLDKYYLVQVEQYDDNSILLDDVIRCIHWMKTNNKGPWDNSMEEL